MTSIAQLICTLLIRTPAPSSAAIAAAGSSNSTAWWQTS
jgi:hypothetical protein